MKRANDKGQEQRKGTDHPGTPLISMGAIDTQGGAD